MAEVSIRAGTRTRRATPSQKSVKTRAVPRARVAVERMKMEKMRRGVQEKKRWVKMKAWWG